MSSKCVLLLSGGLDSGSLLFWAKNQKFDVLPLFVNYGQTSFPGEFSSVQYLLKKAGSQPVSPINIPEIYKLADNNPNETSGGLSIYQYYPSRNLLLLTLAAMFAYKNDISLILIGLISDTINILPDCSPEFINQVQKILQIEYPKIIISAPYISRSKIDIVEEAIEFGLEPGNTFCCNRLADHHCWSCPSCIDRRRVLETLNML
jgi:7-cyano-7-deazaguanine synthase